MDAVGGVLIAVIAAAGGFAVGWVSRPAAQVAAEETRLKTERRRQVVADFRQLIAEVLVQQDLMRIEEDGRFMAARPHMPELRGGYDFDSLSESVDNLEKRWDLI